MWATRHEPHLDRCASAWLIKRFVDPQAEFTFIGRDDPVQSGALPFVLPGASINPIEGEKTAFDVLIMQYGLKDPVVVSIQAIIHDFEVDAGEEVAKIRLPETAGVFKIVRGLARSSSSDQEIMLKAIAVFDALYAELSSERSKKADKGN